jgi:hypothetical protein
VLGEFDVAGEIAGDAGVHLSGRAGSVGADGVGVSDDDARGVAGFDELAGGERPFGVARSGNGFGTVSLMQRRRAVRSGARRPNAPVALDVT